MKKLLLIGSLVLSLGAVGFARGGHGYGGGCGGHGRGNGNGYYNNMMTSNPQIEKSRITIQEKRLDVRKELIKTSPDWKKVEKLNSEIGAEQGKMRTLMEKYRNDNPNVTNY